MIIFWAILFVALVIIELCTFQLVSIWLAIGALFAMLSEFLHFPFIGQLAVFAISSALLLFISLPLIKKNAASKKISTNSDLDVGKHATVIEEINNQLSKGRVNLNGIDWSAVSADDSVIPSGSVVIVSQVSGAKLTVEKINSQKLTK